MEKLAKLEYLNTLKEVLEDIIFFDSAREAKIFSRCLEKILIDNPQLKLNFPELFNQYRKLVLKAKFIALPSLTEGEVIELLRENLLTIFEFKEEVDLIRKLKAFIIAIPSYDKRESFKKELINSLLNNNEKITSKPLTIEAGKEEAPTISNWIKDYNKNFGLEKVDKLKQTEYLVRGPNTSLLSEEERKKIKKIIELYEYLKLSPTSMEGLEEDVAVIYEGRLKILREGRVEPTDPKVAKVLEEILKGKEERKKEIEKQLERKDLSAIERKYLEEELEELTK